MASVISRMAGAILAKNCSPSEVRETLRVLLLNRRTPKRASSDATAWLRAEADRPRSLAAARKLLRAATAATAFSSVKPGVEIMRYGSSCHAHFGGLSG